MPIIKLHPSGAPQDFDIEIQEDDTITGQEVLKAGNDRADFLAGRATVNRRWYQWYANTDTPLERKLLIKMDLLILSFAVLAYWTKFIDQGNLTNAYISGMKEDLGFYGNELVQLQTVYNVSYTVFMIPVTLLSVKYRNVIPACEMLWGIFTLLQYRATSFGELAAYRFFVGAFESGFFTSIHYVLGSWYVPRTQHSIP